MHGAAAGPSRLSRPLRVPRGTVARNAQGRDKASAIEIASSPEPPVGQDVAEAGDESIELDDEEEFEEVSIPHVGAGSGASTPLGLLEPPEAYESYLDEEEEDEEDQVIRLEIGGETEEEKAKRLALAMRRKPLTSKDRAIRLETHKMHVVSLLASARIRNRWASNQLLQARLLSLLPHALQSAFIIPKKRFPDQAQRARLFYDALQSLVSWWAQVFFDISDWTLGQRTRSWDEVQEVVDTLPRLSKADLFGSMFTKPLAASPSSAAKGNGKGKGKEREEEDETMAALQAEFGGERLRSVNSLMKKALQQEGSRDVSAQLFVALARVCGLGARLVVSIQGVPWKAEKVIPKKKTGAGSGARLLARRQGMGDDPGTEAEDLVEVPIPDAEGDTGNYGRSKRAKGKEPMRGPGPDEGAGPSKPNDPADVYRLRKQRPAPQTIGSGKPQKRRRKTEDLMNQPPVFWAEVYSRVDKKWIPVDPVNGTIRKRAPYEPSAENGPVRMCYVVAFEEDGHARDVTLRYAKSFGAKTSKIRPPANKDGDDWWKKVTAFLQRPVRLQRDELEDAELEFSQVSEGMPLHMTGFKDHPIYVLERHLKRDEIILPKREIGRFKGEAVYRRSNVLQCKTAEGWMRIGRQIKIRQEPLKWVKQRAVTIQKRRAQELAHQDGQETRQGIYAEYQTELYRPLPIKDGIVPRNDFGNIHLFVPTMLPEGAAHLAYKGIAKVAKQLGVSYADAVTNFEFRKQRALPVITGIVVAAENEEAVLDAYWKSAAAAEEREKVRREERALKRWAKLVNGLRVRLRLQAEYGTGIELHEESRNPMADIPKAPDSRAAGTKSAASIIAASNLQSSEAWKTRMRGGSVEPEEDVKPTIETEGGLEIEEELAYVAPPPKELLPVPPSPAPSSDGEELAQVSEAARPPKLPDTPQRKVAAGGAAAIPDQPDSDLSDVPPEPEPEVVAPRRPIIRLRLAPAKAIKAAEAVEDEEPAVRPGRSKRGAGAPRRATKPGPKTPKTATKRGRGAKKRKAETDESNAELSGDEMAPAPVSRGKRAAAVTVPAPTRVLRSRAAKTETQEREEKEKRERMRAALASDDEFE